MSKYKYTGAINSAEIAPFLNQYLDGSLKVMMCSSYPFAYSSTAQPPFRAHSCRLGC